MLIKKQFRHDNSWKYQALVHMYVIVFDSILIILVKQRNGVFLLSTVGRFNIVLYVRFTVDLANVACSSGGIPISISVMTTCVQASITKVRVHHV